MDKRRIEGCSLVAFWRLANDYETNWHAGRRRDGGSYQLAYLEASLVEADWDFLVGGIECPEEYTGDVALVVAAFPDSVIGEASATWVEDDGGWGFRSLPAGHRMTSSVRTFSSQSP